MIDIRFEHNFTEWKISWYPKGLIIVTHNGYILNIGFAVYFDLYVYHILI